MSYVGYKIILHPTEEQIEKIETQFQQARNYWNLMVALNEYLYADAKVKAGEPLSDYVPKHGKSQQEFYDTYKNSLANKTIYDITRKLYPEAKHLSRFDMTKIMGGYGRTLTFNKGEKDLASDTRNAIAESLDLAYKAFFKDKTGKKGKPRFKHYFRSISIRGYKIGKHQFAHTQNNWYTKIINIGLVPCTLTRQGIPNGIIKNYKVTRTSTGRYVMSFTVKQPDYTPSFKRTKCVGIDLNVSADSFIALSTGDNFTFPQQWFKDMEAKLAKAQRKLDRRINRYKEEQAKQVAYFKSIGKPECTPAYNPMSVSGIVKARHYRAKVAKQIEGKRKALLDAYTTQLAREYNFIALEDLRVANMVRNHHLAKSIARMGLRTVRIMLEQKSLKYNCEVVVVSPKNTSQTCSACGYLLTEGEKLTLADREWVCPKCGTQHIRDTNSAKNILKKALDNK